jgi:hypothetical protein
MLHPWRDIIPSPVSQFPVYPLFLSLLFHRIYMKKTSFFISISDLISAKQEEQISSTLLEPMDSAPSKVSQSRKFFLPTVIESYLDILYLLLVFIFIRFPVLFPLRFFRSHLHPIPLAPQHSNSHNKESWIYCKHSKK